MLKVCALLCTDEVDVAWKYDWIHVNVCTSIVLSALAGYGAMSIILHMIDSFGVAITEVIKSVRKVLQVRTPPAHQCFCFRN